MLLHFESCKIGIFHLYLNPAFQRFCMPLNLHKESHLQDLMISGNVFNTLEKLASNVNRGDLVNSLESSKHYLKTNYQYCCYDSNSSIASHSRKFALSDPNE